MLKNRSPAPLAGGNRAGIRYAVPQPSTREYFKAQVQQRLRREHLIRQVHQLGARVMFEFVDELDRVHGLGDDLDHRLERYAALDPEILRALGGDTFAI